MALVRLFAAIRLPGTEADKLENFLSGLKSLAKIKWVSREQFHITLKFIGEIEAFRLEDVKNALVDIKNFKAFNIELDYIGAFPNLNAPKILWLSGDKGATELAKIAKLVNDVLYDEADIPRDDKKFKAHLTLARLKEAHLPEELVRKLGGVPKLRWQCSELVLMKSVLTARGPVYTQLM